MSYYYFAPAGRRARFLYQPMYVVVNPSVGARDTRPLGQPLDAGDAFVVDQCQVPVLSVTSAAAAGAGGIVGLLVGGVPGALLGAAIGAATPPAVSFVREQELRYFGRLGA